MCLYRVCVHRPLLSPCTAQARKSCQTAKRPCSLGISWPPVLARASLLANRSGFIRSSFCPGWGCGHGKGMVGAASRRYPRVLWRYSGWHTRVRICLLDESMEGIDFATEESQCRFSASLHPTGCPMAGNGIWSAHRYGNGGRQICSLHRSASQAIAVACDYATSLGTLERS